MINPELLEQIKFEYLHSSKSGRALAKQYGIPYGTLNKVITKERWVLLRQEESRCAMHNLAPAHEAQRAQMLTEHYDAATALMDSTMKAHEKLNQLLELDEPLAPRDIKAITGALFDLKALYGVHSEEERREIEARIRKLEKDCEEKTPEDRTITVVFGNEEEVTADA